MSQRLISSRGEDFLVAFPDDEERPPGALLRGIARAQVLDDLTGHTPAVPVSASSERPFIHAKVTGGGVLGLVGVPQRIFSPDLQLNADTLEARLSAPGFIDRAAQLSVGPFPTFPDEFDLGASPEIRLHREPVLITGRVTRSATGAAIGGVTVSVETVWPQLPDPALMAPGDDPDLVEVRPTLARPIVSGPSRVRAFDFTFAVTDAAVLANASAGDRTLQLSNRVGLLVDDLLWLHRDDPDRAEFVRITDIQGAASDQHPARVRLAAPLAHAHAIRSTAVRVEAPVFGADNALLRAGFEGDRTLHLDGFDDLPAAFVAIDEGAAPHDVHAIRAYSATTDADGRYALPPIHRFAQVDLRADDGAGGVASMTYCPDYDAPVNRLDIAID